MSKRMYGIDHSLRERNLLGPCGDCCNARGQHVKLGADHDVELADLHHSGHHYSILCGVMLCG